MAWAALVAVCLVALTSAFLFSLRQAQFHFDRAALAQDQLLAVAQIEMLIERTGRAPADLIDAYVRSIATEEALLTGAAVVDPQEVADAKRLAAIAATDTTGLSVQARADLQKAAHDLVAVISDRERAEARDSAIDMARLRTQMSLLGIAIALVAACTAFFGSWLLWTANSRLTKLVASRTALLEDRNARLAAVDRSRRLFFAKISHELRTPVAVMRGEAEVSLADPAESQAALREALFHVTANAEFLERRLADLLGVARADDGQLRLDFAPVELGAMVNDVKAEAEKFARSSGVSLAVEAPAAPVMVNGDRRWLGQALLSIVDNGVKFSPNGGTLRIRLAAADGQALIEVADSGAGVPPAELPLLFDAFYQTEEGRARGGSGLGLALTRWLVEQHKGAVRAANGNEGGCVFTVALPVAA